MSIPRRKIEELVALYELHPNFRDVFVEGARDKSVLEWFLGEQRANAVVYEISTIEIRADEVLRFGLEDANRGRVIALAYILDAHLGPNTRIATCIADSDFELMLQCLRSCDLLLLTDYTCIEMYSFNEHALGKFLKLFIGKSQKSAEIVLREIAGALRELFLIRLANRVLGFGLEQLPFRRYCTITQDGVSLDTERYIQDYLSKNGKRTEIARFKETMNEYRRTLPEDPRACIHGHDFEVLFVDYFRQHGGDRNIPGDFLCRALMLSVKSAYLAEQPLFRRLIERLQD